MASGYDVLVTDKPTQNLKKQLTPFFHKIENMPLFSYPEWDDIIRHQTGNPVFRMVVRKQGEIVATAAFTLIRSRFFKDRLVSSGYFTGSNLLYIDADAVPVLLEKIYQIAQDNQLSFVEFKGQNLEKYPHIALKNDLYYGFQCVLGENSEEILLNIKRKKRADIRKALGNKALKFEDNVSFDDFYRIYSTSQRDLGTPIHIKSFYRAIADLPSSHICGVRYKGKIIAVCMYFEDSVTCLAYYGGALHSARGLHAYDLMYYKLMCLAAGRGRMVFDFGRSKAGTGAFHYKKLWGFTPEAIPHSFMQMDDAPLPNNTPLNKKYHLAIHIWKKLPLWLVNCMGPFIIRQLG